jgi:hypothetical protein
MLRANTPSIGGVKQQRSGGSVVLLRQRSAQRLSTLVAKSGGGGEQKGDGIYFEYEPVEGLPTNPKLLEIGECVRCVRAG